MVKFDLMAAGTCSFPCPAIRHHLYSLEAKVLIGGALRVPTCKFQLFGPGEDVETDRVKYRKLQIILREMGRLVVAFSGGVDSTLLLKVARETLGQAVLAVTVRSETTAQEELAEAIELAKALGVKHFIVDTSDLQIPGFADNSPERCYLCKRSRFSSLTDLAKRKGFRHVADGTNMDDHQDYRPGMRANRELEVRSPLAEAGFTKEDVRALSRELGLPTWNKPSLACLASRIPYGSVITAKKLEQVDLCERFIRDLGIFRQIRVRHCGDTARIEVDAERMAELLTVRLREQIIEYFKKTGFKYVTLDLEGYRMGSLNLVIDRGRESRG